MYPSEPNSPFEDEPLGRRLFFIGFGLRHLVVLVLILYVVVAILKPFAASVPFSDAAHPRDKVYVDIVSIWPAIGLYDDEEDEEFSEIICGCYTPDGDLVWIYMKGKEYLEYFDSTLSLDVMNSQYEELFFANPKRIHGRVWRADDISDDLSEDIGGEYLIGFRRLE